MKSDYDWHFGVVADALPALAVGAAYTILITALTFAGGIVLGLGLCLTRMSGRRWLAWPTIAVIDFLRLTPLLVQILWIYSSVPLLTGVTLSPFWSGVLALAVNSSAFTCEVFRSGFGSIDDGQREAASALGMSWFQMLRRVLIPQAARHVLPPLGTSWVSCFQDTSLVAVLGVPEILHNAQLVSTETLRPVEVFTAVGIVYFLLAYPQARLLDRLDRRERLNR
ncbi:polar amino acid transport system permease protein [Amycolatopsis sulphurea]|uniref:Polar amino acid transport system permease protein n=1 Tax=Amycolatopsis sulphurea TaxID=76022 RepID=A0A2A9FGF7_9PSEU|nr:amino acid ABC transporter permease [Amycolatopsis sulphurea]PFG49662.1 polar amino acid transport system permease protein [Amycolatopsis sulphurea]